MEKFGPKKKLLQKRNEFCKDNELDRVNLLAERELETFDIVKKASKS